MTATFQVHDVNGIADLTLSLTKPGVYVMRGRNGAGKTSAINAVRAALGDKSATAQPTDGMRAGTVEGPGVTLHVGKNRRRDGTPDVGLADSGPLATLIDPRLKGDEARAKARIQALLQLCPIEVTDEMLADLCCQQKMLLDRIGTKHGNDLLGYAARVKAEAQAIARECETRAADLKGEMAVADARLGEIGTVPEGTVDTTEEEDRASIEQATKRFALKEQSFQQRVELEERKAKVRESLGDRPNVEWHRSRVNLATAALDELKVKIAQAQAEHTAAVEGLRKAEREATTWDGSARILEQPLSGASSFEVMDAKLDLDRCKTSVELTRALRARRKALEDLDRARMLMRTAEKDAAGMRGVSDAIPAALARALRGAGIPGLTVHDGKLAIQTDAGVLDWEERLSFGQKVRFALQVALQAAQHDGARVFALDPEFWLALDPEHRTTAHAIAREIGVYLLTEEPAEGALRMEAMETAQ